MALAIYDVQVQIYLDPIYDVQVQIYLDPGANKPGCFQTYMIFIAEKWLETKPPTWSLWLVFPLFSFLLSWRMKHTLSVWRVYTPWN